MAISPVAGTPDLTVRYTVMELTRSSIQGDVSINFLYGIPRRKYNLSSPFNRVGIG
jgi:hypothetical protein